MASNKKGLSLFSLAPELREMIYQEYFRSCVERSWRRPLWDQKGCVASQEVEIFCVSRLVREEAKAMFIRKLNAGQLLLGRNLQPTKMTSLFEFAKGWTIVANFSIRAVVPSREMGILLTDDERKTRSQIYSQTRRFLKYHGLMQETECEYIENSPNLVIQHWRADGYISCNERWYGDGGKRLQACGTLLALDWSLFGQPISSIKRLLASSGKSEGQEDIKAEEHRKRKRPAQRRRRS